MLAPIGQTMRDSPTYFGEPRIVLTRTWYFCYVVIQPYQRQESSIAL
jgi:hypothetical protein